jgi:putative membrane protein
MWTSAFGSAVHLLALALGVAGLSLRIQSLRRLSVDGLKSLFWGDSLWGLAALLWIVSGLSRLLWLEKSPEFYLRNGFFYVKMAAFLAVFALEISPMIHFIRWRIAVAKGQTPDTSRAPFFLLTSRIQLAIVAGMVFIASLMARGVWVF